MKYVYDTNGVIDKSKSIYFSLDMPDTLSLGKPYIGEFKFNSDVKSEDVLGYYTIVSDKLSKYFENINTIKELDTFFVATPGFRYIPKSVGEKTLRIKILEKYMIVTPDKKDTTQVTIRVTHRPFFYEKKIFIKDTI